MVPIFVRASSSRDVSKYSEMREGALRDEMADVDDLEDLEEMDITELQ